MAGDPAPVITADSDTTAPADATATDDQPAAEDAATASSEPAADDATTDQGNEAKQTVSTDNLPETGEQRAQGVVAAGLDVLAAIAGFFGFDWLRKRQH